MKKNCIIFLILIAGCNFSNDVPYGLMVEFIRQPEYVQILDSKPEFSWIVPTQAKYQSAFQIQVASSKSKLTNNEADVWDSGKSESSNSVEVEYNGSQLKENTKYYWRVRIWDHQDNVTDFSNIQSFTTGNLNDHSTSKNMFQSKLVKAKRIVKITDSHYFIDFGKDAFGTLLLFDIRSQADTVIIHIGEKANGNSVDKDPQGSIRYQKATMFIEPNKSKYKLNLPENKRNTTGAAIQLPDSIGVVFPFRYCEIENFNGELATNNIIQKVFTYYFEDNESHFESSDTILNRVWDLSKYSIKATSFTGLYVDGDRERIPYEADAYINQLGHYYTDREYSMARITNEYFIDHPTWPTEWILHTVPMFYYDLMFTGNIESVKYYYEDLKQKTLISLAREDGLISSQNVTDKIMTQIGFSNSQERIRDIVDWPPGQKDTGWKLARPEGERDGYDFGAINTVVNSFHYQNLKLISKLAGYLGKEDDSKFFLERAVEVKISINEKLLNKEKGVYIDGESSHHSSLHANMFPLAFDIVPPEHLQSVVDFVKSRGMACSVYGSQYLMEGLFNAGEWKYAIELITATHDRSWWNMIKSGSTITMEAWDMKYKPNSDWNHAWGAAPANIIPGYLWGIKPTEPGYAKAEIKPQMGLLKSSKVQVPTIRGPIKAEYMLEGESKKYIINIPGNMESEFIVTDSDISDVYINGKIFEKDNNRFKLQPGTNVIILKY